MLVDFYHLASTPLERVLPRICERLLENGERLLVVGDDPLLSQLDELLWTYSGDSFLPHGRETSPQAAHGVWREEALGFARTFYFFDNGHLDTARGSWRALKAVPEATARYWKQDPAGKWVQGP
jgi:DNA polymerase-3 subunit chi